MSSLDSLKAIVGDAVPDSTLEAYLARFGSVEAAANAYFDGTPLEPAGQLPAVAAAPAGQPPYAQVAPQPAGQPPGLLRIIVPPGAGTGSTVQVQTAQGLMYATVPPGCFAGSQFDLQMAVPAAPAVPVAAATMVAPPPPAPPSSSAAAAEEPTPPGFDPYNMTATKSAPKKGFDPYNMGSTPNALDPHHTGTLQRPGARSAADYVSAAADVATSGLESAVNGAARGTHKVAGAMGRRLIG